METESPYTHHVREKKDLPHRRSVVKRLNVSMINMSNGFVLETRQIKLGIKDLSCDFYKTVRCEQKLNVSIFKLIDFTRTPTRHGIKSDYR